MTPPDHEQTRTDALLVAFGCGVLAIVAFAALLLLGLSAPARDEVAARRAATASPDRGRDQLRRTADRRSAALPARAPDGRLFAPGSFWNKRLPATAALDPSSAILVGNLLAEVAREQATRIGPWISAGRRAAPLYRVGPDQRRVRVRLDNGNERFRRTLRRAFAS